MSAQYKEHSSTTSKHMLLHSDKKSNGDYLWSCGYYTDGITEKAIYSFLTSSEDLFAAKQLAPSKCFGIQGISSSQAYLIRAMYPTVTTPNHFLSKITFSGSAFSTSSYNMGSKIDVGISLEKAIFNIGSNFGYMIGKYQFLSPDGFQGYLMKMSTNFGSPSYSLETIEAFTLALTSDVPSLFEAAPSWTHVSSPQNNLFVRTDVNPIQTLSFNSNSNPLQLNTGSYSTSYISQVTIVPSIAVNQNYDLGTNAGTTFYQVPPFSLSPTGSPGTIAYNDAAPVSFVNFDGLSRTFNWSGIQTTGTYTLKMQGSLAGSTSVTVSFSLTISRTTLLASVAIDQTYQLGATPTGPTSYTVPYFSTNPPGSELSVNYTDISTPLPAGVIFSGTTNTYDWSSLKTQQTFTLTLQGKLGTSTINSTSFTVSIIQPTTIQPMTPISFNYYLYIGQTFITGPLFDTIPQSSQNLVVYSDESGKLPSGMTFDSASRQYSWDTSISPGVYPLKMKGSIPSMSSQNLDITLTIKAPLIIASITINKIFDLNKMMENSKYIVPAFSSQPSGIEGLIIYSDESVSLPTEINFSPSTREYDWSKVNSIGNFTIIMKGSMSQCLPAVTTFQLNIIKASSSNTFYPNSPPYFDKVLSDITIDLGKSQIFKFPNIIDHDQGDTGTFLSINIGLAFTFVTCVYPNLIITPFSDRLDVGTFPIQVKLKDTHNATSTFNFKIIVISFQPQNHFISQRNTTDSQSVLTASLQSINNQGLAIIVFNRDIFVIKNLTAIDENILGIKTVAGMQSNYKDLNISSWNVTKMEPRKLIISIQFQTILKISMQDIKDKLEIEFKNPQFIVDQETRDNIRPQTIIRNQIPKQMPKDPVTLILQRLGPTFKFAISAFVVGNFAIQLIMSASLQFLWGMVNVLQIIVHIPLINAQFPENTMYFQSLMIDISSFNLIPDSWMTAIVKRIFYFKEEEFDESFSKMGYESENIISNLGSMFVYQIGLLCLVVFVILIRFLKNRFEFVNKIYNFLAKIIFWGMILRMLLESYLEYALSSLINLYKLQWDTRSNSFSSIFSIILLLSILIFPILVWHLLWKNFQKLQEQQFQQSFGSIYLELRTSSKIALLYNVIFMLRRLLFSIVILALRKWPFAQIQIMIFHCILVIKYIIWARPFESPLVNQIEIFNELCIIGASYHLIVFTQFIDDPQIQYNVGWSMIGVTILNILVNTAVMAFYSFQQLKRIFLKFKFIIQAYIIKWKQRKSQITESNQNDQNIRQLNQPKIINNEEELKLENVSFQGKSHNKQNVKKGEEFEKNKEKGKSIKEQEQKVDQLREQNLKQNLYQVQMSEKISYSNFNGIMKTENQLSNKQEWKDKRINQAYDYDPINEEVNVIQAAVFQSKIEQRIASSKKRRSRMYDLSENKTISFRQ